MEPGAEEASEQQAGEREAAAENPCAICLGEMDNAAYIDGCFHAFCFRCIRRWAATTATCPLCRQPFHRVLHSVRADDDYRQYVVGPSARGRAGRAAAERRARSRSPQRRHHLPPRPGDQQPAAGRRGPEGRRLGPWGDTAPGHPEAFAQQPAGERPAGPAGEPRIQYDLVALRERLIAFLRSRIAQAP